MKLSLVVPLLNQHELTRACFNRIKENAIEEVEYIFIDNGSDVPFEMKGVKVIRNEKGTGVYPTFKQGFDVATGDVVAFLHSDVVIWEKGWDKRIVEEFEKDRNLGMIGFVGSSEIDYMGGRGLGTASNFMGRTLDKWTGSPAEVHGKRITNAMPSCVVDGCVMIIRRQAWNEIGVKGNFPPHHFYDRLISTQLIEKNWKIITLGIEFDHFNGQTVSNENKYHTMAEEWASANNIPFCEGWDNTIYKEAERRWLKEYRDEKHLIPIKV